MVTKRKKTTDAPVTQPSPEPSPEPFNTERFVLFLRHGQAEERGGEKPDEDRTLTREGHARMKQIASGLTELFPKADAVYTSPLIRCVQTALWVSKGYHGKLQPVSTPALRPEATPRDVIAFLEAQPARRPILVGHEPNLSSTVARLIGAEGAGALELKKGGCFGVRIAADGSAVLEWSLPPRLLRKIG